MHKHRLDKLAKLTQGAALVGLGLVAGCKRDPVAVNAPDPTLHINSPPEPQPSGSATATATATEPIHINAPPQPEPSTSPSATSAPLRQPPHVNAPFRVNKP